MKKFKRYSMFPFETQVKCLAGFTLGISLIFFITQLSLRVKFEVSGEIPKWLRSVNFDVSGQIQDTSQASQNFTFKEILPIITWYGYIFLHLVLAAYLWSSANEKSLIKLVIWIIACVILTTFGILLLNYIYDSIEIGLAYIFVKLSFVYMLFTICIVGLLMLKLKFENIEGSITD